MAPYRFIEAVEEAIPAEKQVRIPTTIVSEVILENFMSYDYARIPLMRGLNVICGPNGAGKSSILLAISVALGQTYTERSRKLADLIRRGKDVARVSLLFDNRMQNGRRPIPFSRTDTFMLSRYLKLDGSYWYEADYHEISKSEVVRLFDRFGINPDNLLIIMHQGMVEEFSITSPQEKLRMVEEAAGFKRYRERILEAQSKLAGLVSEESSLLQIMQGASQTLDYWKSVYGRYLQKKSLLERRAFLERELVWAQAVKSEKQLQTLAERFESKTHFLSDLISKIDKAKALAAETLHLLNGQQTQLRKLYFSLLRLEKEKTKSEVEGGLLKRAQVSAEELTEFLTSLVPKVEAEAQRILKEKIEGVDLYRRNYTAQAEESQRRRKDLENEIQAIQQEIGKTEKEIASIMERYVGLRINDAVLSFQRRLIEREITEIKRSVKEVEEHLRLLSPQLEAAMPRIETERSPAEVAEELRIVIGHLQSFDDVPTDAEKIYADYANTYEELKKKLETVAENKQHALVEVEERKKVWRKAIQGLVDEVGPIFQDILAKINATGAVRLVDVEDVEVAGLELLIGFRGTEPTILDAYTQSGGERSVAVMAFLLSLQQRVVSPLRAVDEFDLHLDPRNREAVLQMIFSYVKNAGGAQYLVITPLQLTVLEPEAHVLVVQNAAGRSSVQELKGSA